MKYKVLPESSLFSDIQELRRRGIESDKAAEKWIIDFFGEFKKYVMPCGNIWGGIEAVELPRKPDGWKVYGDSWSGCFAPKAVNKKIWREWRELPRVRTGEMKALLNYGNYSGPNPNGGFGLVWSSFPGLTISDSIILVETSEVAKAYVPVEGMVEILGSEFLELQKSA